MKRLCAVKPVLALGAAAFAVTALLPVWLASGHANLTAFSFYATALSEFSSAFWFGDEPYPRFLDQVNGGLGSPVFFFYPPVAFWLSGLFEPMALDDPTGATRLMASMALAAFASGLSCYLWLRRSQSGNMALLGALIYVLLPIRLVYACMDFNLAQCWALVWLPLALRAIDGIVAGRLRTGASCAVFYALLAMTHVPTFIIFLPVSFAYCAFTGADTPGRSWAQLGTLACSLCLALGLACAYLFPLAPLHVLMNHTTGPFSSPSYDAGMFLTPVFYMCLPLAAAAWWLYRVSPAPDHLRLRPWYLLLALVMFMMTPLSRTLWERVLPLQFLQAPPLRFAAALFPVASVLGVGLARYARWNAPACLSVAVALIFCSGYPFYAALNTPAPPQTALQATSPVILPEFFRTRWVGPQVMRPDSLDHWKKAADIQFHGGTGDATVESWHVRSMTLSIHVTSDTAQLILKRFFFPGWSVLSGNAPTGIRVYPTRPEGLMTLILPRGNYHLTLLLDHVPGEGPGWFMSLLSLCVLGAWILIGGFVAARQADKQAALTDSNAPPAHTGTKTG